MKMKPRQFVALLLFTACMAGPAAYGFWPFQEGKSAGELGEGPSIPYLSETEHRRFIEDLKGAALVLDARIEAMVVTRMGLGGPPVPQARVVLEDIRALKGRAPRETTFSYAGSPAKLKFGKGTRVVAVMTGGEKGQPRIERLYAASKPLLTLAREILGPPPPASGAES